MDFATALVAARKARNMTQQQLAEATGIHVTQLRRYEGGTAEPSVAVLRRLAVALSVMTDELLFERTRRPKGTALSLAFEAAQGLSRPDQQVVCRVVEALVAQSTHDERPEGSRRHR